MDPSNSLLSQSTSGTETIHHPQVPDLPAAATKTPETLENQIEEKPTAEKVPEESNQGGDADGEEDDEEEEEEGECGFCLFMKGGGCKDTFTEWEKCVEEGENNNENIVDKCFQATAALKKCMEAHSDYYAPLLEAEKAAEEEAVKQLEKEKERSNNQEKRDEVEELGDKENGKALREGEGNK